MTKLAFYGYFLKSIKKVDRDQKIFFSQNLQKSVATHIKRATSTTETPPSQFKHYKWHKILKAKKYPVKCIIRNRGYIFKGCGNFCACATIVQPCGMCLLGPGTVIQPGIVGRGLSMFTVWAPLCTQIVCFCKNMKKSAVNFFIVRRQKNI